MHLSLKGSMDRQPLTDRLGDKLLAEYGGAAAAYSLRSLSGDQTKVVRVRRSSDNAEKDFTASEMGTALEDWVNTDVTIYQSNFSSDTNGWSGSTASPVGNQDGVSDGTTSKDNVLKLTKAQDSQGYIQRDQGVVAGLTYTVSGSFYAPSSNTAVDGILIKDGVTGSSLSLYPSGYLTSIGVWTDFSFSYTATVSGTQRINMAISSLGSVPNGNTTGSTGDVVYISDLQFVETTSNGFVETWYDQSGNGNDATQTVAANQPKIVDAGTYLGEIKFENGLYVEKTGLSLSGPFSTFSLSNANSQHSGALLKFGTGFSQQYRGDYSLLLQYGDLNFSSAGVYTVGEQNVMSFIFDSTSLGYYNGTEVINDAATGATATQFRVGNSSFGLDGDVKEVIIYNSNQSANRAAIETNINNHYSIY